MSSTTLLDEYNKQNSFYFKDETTACLDFGCMDGEPSRYKYHVEYWIDLKEFCFEQLFPDGAEQALVSDKDWNYFTSLLLAHAMQEEP